MEYFNPIFHIVIVTINQSNVSGNFEDGSMNFEKYGDAFKIEMAKEIKHTYSDLDNNIFRRKCSRIRRITHRMELSDLYQLCDSKKSG